ncbi:MAG: arginine deiminase-related protein [Gammaproteobacteria bacterium]|nr:arginine deiminase-related protein [Gammaproteobacteria bacterium]MDH5305105.1 arginine deiminase-related protein [Gammaproteobacteria bacterium]MDH5321772.1 arginine deiminase-related protein [Gammaproteobacteria bacterium]
MTNKFESQLASGVLMIRPVRFESNPMTAESNKFQGRSRATPAQQNAQAQAEFDVLASKLRDAGIDVVVIDDTPDPHTPDSIFPNNWVSFHSDGRVVLYPMQALNRRTERRLDILERLAAEHNYVVRDIVDLTAYEQADHFLEGTGSMVLDRVNHVAYACLSSRTQLGPLGDFAQQLDYEVMTFDAVDRNGVPIYHTNVLMNIGEQVAVICDAAIPDNEQRSAVLRRLRDTGHEVLSLSYDQLDAFAGNMLELRGSDGARVTTMSQQAFDSLYGWQLQRLRSNGRIVHAAIDNIEASAGGSVRCMLAEIHLPKK